MSKEYRFAEDHETMKRRAALDRLVDVLVDPDSRPWFTSDQATVFEISYEMPDEIIAKIKRAYGVVLTREQLEMPVWKLLDFLNASAGKPDSQH